jgi:hypothetical protein
MSGSNDALTQMLLLQQRNQGRRPSAQARLAEQMMAQLNNPAPIYGAGPAIARVGQGVLAGLMSGMAERDDRAREDDQFQRIQDRQDKQLYLGRQAVAEAETGQAPAPQMAPPPAMPTAAPASPPEGDPSLPRGYRNNNPLNIVDAPFTRGQPGFQGNDGRFGRFDTMDNGINAADRLLQSYAGRGLNTPQAIINRWAPAGDGNNNPTAYANTIARELGIAPDAPIDMADPATRRRLIDAMAKVENGRPLSAGAPAGQPQPQPQAQPGADLLARIQRFTTLAGSGGPGSQEAAQRLRGLQWQYEQLQRGATADAAAAERAVDNARAERQIAIAEGARGDARMAQKNEAARAQENADRTVILQKNERAGAAATAADSRNFERANTLRDEFTRLTPDFRTVQTSFNNIEAAARSNTGAGDMSMLYSFVKLLDPTSVVRESEFAMAAASGSLGERMQGAVGRILSGERLPDSLRNSFLAEAQNLYTNNRRNYDRIADQYRGIAERYGIPVEQVIPDFALPREAPPPPPPPAPPPPPPVRPPGMVDRARARNAPQPSQALPPGNWEPLP